MSRKTILILSYIIIMILIIIFGAVSIYMYLEKNNNVPENIDMINLDNKLLTESGLNTSRIRNIDKSNITDFFDIESDKVKEVIGKMPLVDISSGMYVVMHVDSENVEYVTQKLNEFGLKYETKWENYMEDQYELVKQRKIGNIGNYVYMFVYETPEDMIECIK